MKKVERIIIKLVIIQFLFLLFFQMFFHSGDSFLELKKLSKYEGVNRDSYTQIIEVLQKKQTD